MPEAVLQNCIKDLGSMATLLAETMPSTPVMHQGQPLSARLCHGRPVAHQGKLGAASITKLEIIIFQYIENKSAYLGSQGGHRADATSNLKALKMSRQHGERDLG